MTQEEKELLLKDLSARVPHRVYISPVDCGKAILIGIKDGNPLLWDTIHRKEYDKPWNIEYIKPYLRLMSSMTEEELHEIQKISGKGIELRDSFINIIDSSRKRFSYSELETLFNWLNKKMFDYRGLIEKGLAIKAPEEMYSLKK